MEVQTLPRRERERLRRRKEMLDAAKAVFAERGYEHATLDEIAQRAEYGKGTLYNYFEGGKEELLHAIFDEIYDDLYAVVQSTFTPEVRGDRSFREVFHGFVEACFRFFQERQHLFLILVKEVYRLMLGADPDTARYFMRQQHRIMDATRPMFEDAMARGELRRMDSNAIAHAVFGNIKGMQMHRCIHTAQEGEPSVTPEEGADFMTTLLLDGLCCTPETPARRGTPSDPARTN